MAKLFGLEEDELLLLGLAALFVTGKLTSAAAQLAAGAKRITDEVERFKNFGVTDDESLAAQKVIGDEKASIPDKLAAVKVLRGQVDKAKAGGLAGRVEPLEKLLNLYERNLHGQEDLEVQRKQWEERRAARAAKN